MSVAAVVGLQWGDEGKGKIVDRLAAGVRHVARFQGGHNAGHTVMRGGRRAVLHLLPSGVLHKNALCYIGAGVVVSPADLLREIGEITGRGGARERLFVADGAALILPYHRRLDGARDDKNHIGTTRRGIGPAHEDKVGRRALRLYDLFNGRGRARLADNAAFYNAMLARHGEAPLDADEVWGELQAQAAAMRPYLCGDIGARLAAAAAAGENILLEGAQGALLDIEHGTYPFTTSASCIAAAAAGGLGADLAPAALGVIKAYCTRVGNGPFPTEDEGGIGALLAERGGEFGATTGRPRRCGWLDAPMLRHAARLNGCRRLIVTKLDVMDALDEVKICVAYELDGARLELPPSDPGLLPQCRAIYETLPGWRGRTTADMTDEARLPAAAQAYLRRVEELIGAAIDIISTGADRDAVIIRRAPFAQKQV